VVKKLQLRTHIDVPMHLLFLGIVKTVVRMIQAWFGLRGRTESFIQNVFGVLESIQDLGLSCLPVVPYSGVKLAGWISENYMTLCRLICWFYSCLSEVARDFNFDEPKTPQRDWTMKQNHSWLKARDLNLGTGSLHAVQLSHHYNKT
jgi:hypothetical protein